MGLGKQQQKEVLGLLNPWGDLDELLTLCFSLAWSRPWRPFGEKTSTWDSNPSVFNSAFQIKSNQIKSIFLKMGNVNEIFGHLLASSM